MKLQTARKSYPDATDQDVEAVFADDELRGEYVVLTAEGGSYIQAAGEGEGPYQLEYRDAEVRKQFQAAQPPEKTDVRGAFLDFLRGGSTWREREWKEIEVRGFRDTRMMDEAEKRGCLGVLLALVSWLTAALALSHYWGGNWR
jgi:hypothetical protein